MKSLKNWNVLILLLFDSLLLEIFFLFSPKKISGTNTQTTLNWVKTQPKKKANTRLRWLILVARWIRCVYYQDQWRSKEFFLVSVDLVRMESHKILTDRDCCKVICNNIVSRHEEEKKVIWTYIQTLLLCAVFVPAYDHFSCTISKTISIRQLKCYKNDCKLCDVRHTSTRKAY